MRKRYIGVIILMFFLVFALQVPVFAASSEEEISLSMDDAVSRALRYSKALESTKLDTEIAEQNKWDMAGVWHPSFITDYNEDADAAGLYETMPKLDFAVDAARKTEKMREDMVVAATYSKYYGVLQALDSLEGAEKALASAEKKFAVKQLYFEVGMLSNIEYEQEAVAFASSKTSLTVAQNSLENAYIAFNQQVGLKTLDRPVLTDEPVFTALELENPDSTIRSIVNNSPSQWLAKEGAKLRERLSDAPGSDEQDAIGAEQADIDADSLYDSTLKDVYYIYYGIKGIEDGYQVAVQGVKLAEKAYAVAELQYEVGMGTQADVLEAESSLIDEQNGVKKLIYQHNLMKIAFEKPWCAGEVLGSSSTSGSDSSSSDSSAM